MQHIKDKLYNYILFSRNDSEDSSKHMGLVSLISKSSKLMDKLSNIEASCFRLRETMRNGSIETCIQGMILKFKEY